MRYVDRELGRFPPVVAEELFEEPRALRRSSGCRCACGFADLKASSAALALAIGSAGGGLPPCLLAITIYATEPRHRHSSRMSDDESVARRRGVRELNMKTLVDNPKAPKLTDFASNILRTWHTLLSENKF